MERLCKLWGKAYKQISCNQMSVANFNSPPFSGFSYTGNRAGPMPFAANYRAPLFAGNKTDKGGTSFRELGQTYVNITEDTANVTYITSKVRDSCGDERLELFTSNGLKVNDTEGTRGKYHLYST